jgi:general secretion pathway protein A
MDFQDTLYYINHRLEVAGGKGGVAFSKGALKRIYGYSRGLPRLINAACDRALLTGYTRDMARINSRIATAGIKDLRRSMAFYSRRGRLILIPAFVMLAALFAGGVYFKWDDFIGQFNASQHVEATEEQEEEDPVVTGEELSRAMAAELGGVTEAESARRAFNILAGIWNVQSVPESDNLDRFNGMERAALDRELRLYKFSGNLGALLRIGYPAALELTMDGIPGKRFISLVGMENEQLLVDPPIAGRRSLTFSELEKHWSGQGFLLWRDILNVLTGVSKGSKGGQIRQLQDLLREAGAYGKPLSGVYDNDTLLAVKEFQSAKGIEQDGIVGGQTLMHLYRSIDRFGVPRITAGQK